MDIAPWQLLFPESVAPPPPSCSSPIPPVIDHVASCHDPATAQKQQSQTKSFAQALRNSCDVPYSQLPKPHIFGDVLSIKMPEEGYLAGLEECKKHLHGRLTLSKGDAPVRNQDLRSKL